MTFREFFAWPKDSSDARYNYLPFWIFVVLFPPMWIIVAFFYIWVLIGRLFFLLIDAAFGARREK